MSPPRRRSQPRFYRRLVALSRRRDPRRRGLWGWIRTRLLVGFLVAFPLVVTVFFGRFLFNVLDQWFRPIASRFFGYQMVGVGLGLTLIGMFLLGVIATNVFGSRLLGFFEDRIARLPLLSPIYQGARQITEAIQMGGSTDFRRVVLVRFPHRDARSIGFVTREFKPGSTFGETATALVFVPTTPNPTSGFLVSVPIDDLQSLDISVEEGVKLVISGGLLTPPNMLADWAGHDALVEDDDSEDAC